MSNIAVQAEVSPGFDAILESSPTEIFMPDLGTFYTLVLSDLSGADIWLFAEVPYVNYISGFIKIKYLIANHISTK